MSTNDSAACRAVTLWSMLLPSVLFAETRFRHGNPGPTTDFPTKTREYGKTIPSSLDGPHGDTHDSSE